MSGSREQILRRIREALSVPSDPHLRRAGTSGPRAAGELGEWLPPVGASYAERKALFLAVSDKLKTEVCCVAGPDAAGDELARRAREAGWRRVATHSHPLTRHVQQAVELEWLQTEPAYDVAQLEACDAGLTACDALIAQTGSVLVTAASAGGRALSVLPPHHVVLATADQLLPDLPAAFALLRARYAAEWPSFMSFITGPSRTGDIERILVLGAHGPKRLTVLLMEDAASLT